MEDKLMLNRKKINEIDKKMLDLFIERFSCIKNIVDYKMKNELPIFDQKREDELVKYLLDEMKNEELKSYYLEFINHILVLSKSFQMDVLNKEGKQWK